MRLTFGTNLELPLPASTACALLMLKMFPHLIDLERHFPHYSAVSTFAQKTCLLAQHNVVGSQGNSLTNWQSLCMVGSKGNSLTKVHAGKNSQVRLASNMTHNHAVADSIALS